MPDSTRSIGVFYLAWGGGPDSLLHFSKFRSSYLRMSAEVDHRLYIIYNGFKCFQDLCAARALFESVPHTPIFVAEDTYDLSSYFAAASRVSCDLVCFLNTYSEILSQGWLTKLDRHAMRPDVGLVGCSGSYEEAHHPGVAVNVPFPNPHIRSNAFMLCRLRFLAMRPRVALATKLSTHLFEHGIESMTRSVSRTGQRVLVVGRDGRGYDVNEWRDSQTFRQATQNNLLIADNRTRDYEDASLAEKRFLFNLAWGDGSHAPVRVRAVI